MLRNRFGLPPDALSRRERVPPPSRSGGSAGDEGLGQQFKEGKMSYAKLLIAEQLYHILRKRLFETVASAAEIKKVAAVYREALREAARMNLTTSSPEALFTRVTDAYPFHLDQRELVGKFEENEGFQQTRGVIRLMQMVVASLWNSKRAAGIDLIHPYDLDLNLAGPRPCLLGGSQPPPARQWPAGGQIREEPGQARAGLGKELCILCWAVEQASPDDIPNALHN